MLIQRTALGVAAALTVASCGSGGDSSTTPIDEPSGPALESGDEAASAVVESLDLVWAIDGEPVPTTFDYSEPIERSRFDAGLRLVLQVSTDGDVGGVESDLILPVTINGDAIDGGATFGPERANTRPSRDDIVIVETDGGFSAQIDIGMPLSPVSLRDERERAEDFGLVPDVETETFDDAGLELDIASVLDIPAASTNGRNVIEYEVTGTILFGNGFELGEVERSISLTVTETPSENANARVQCVDVAADYLGALERELADADLVLLDRLRAFRTLVGAALDADCTPSEFAVPVCERATEAADGGIDPDVLARHLELCPDDDVLAEAAVDETVIAATFENGMVHAVVPATLDGLPAYSIAYSVPSNWEPRQGVLDSVRQAVSFDPGDDIIGSLDVDVRNIPDGIDERIDEVLTPETPPAALLVDEQGTVAGREAERMIAQLTTGITDLQVGTAVRIDDARVFAMSGFLGSSTITPAALVDVITCIESSIVIADYDPSAAPTPAADCTSPLEASDEPIDPVEPPGDDVDDSSVDVDVDAEATGDTVSETPEDESTLAVASGFDGETVTLVVPRLRDDPAHVITVGAPPWTLDDVNESESTQRVELAGPETLSNFIVTAGFIGDNDGRLDELLEPLSDWVVVSDVTSEVVGRESRTVVSERTFTNGGVARSAEMALRLDGGRSLTIQLRLGADSTLDLVTEFATALDSVTIDP